MRCETESFADGRRTDRSYSETDALMRIETFAADGTLSARIDYVYDAAGNNTERVLRDGDGAIVRRINLNADGDEIGAAQSGPVRWRSLDGESRGEDEKGQEKFGPEEIGQEKRGPEKIGQEKVGQEKVGQEKRGQPQVYQANNAKES